MILFILVSKTKDNVLNSQKKIYSEVSLGFIVNLSE